MRLPGGSVLSVTEKENCSFPPRAVFLIYRDRPIGRCRQTGISVLEQVIEFVVNKVLPMAVHLIHFPSDVFRVAFKVV